MFASVWPCELYSLLGFSVHGILQAVILEWVVVSFSRDKLVIIPKFYFIKNNTIVDHSSYYFCILLKPYPVTYWHLPIYLRKLRPSNVNFHNLLFPHKSLQVSSVTRTYFALVTSDRHSPPSPICSLKPCLACLLTAALHHIVAKLFPHFLIVLVLFL